MEAWRHGGSNATEEAGEDGKRGSGGDKGENSCISHTCLKHLVGFRSSRGALGGGLLKVINCIQDTVCRVASGDGFQDGSCELELSARGCNTTVGSVGVDSFILFF